MIFIFLSIYLSYGLALNMMIINGCWRLSDQDRKEPDLPLFGVSLLLVALMPFINSKIIVSMV